MWDQHAHAALHMLAGLWHFFLVLLDAHIFIQQIIDCLFFGDSFRAPRCWDTPPFYLKWARPVKALHDKL